MREENARLAKLEPDAAELARLRQEQNELLRLRGELTQLRKRLSESQAVQPKAPVSSPTAPKAASPVQTYIANLAAQVPPHQTLLTGGWKTSEGKRTLVFITPNTLEESSPDGRRQVDLQSWLIEMPEAVVSRFGWDQIKAEAQASSQHGLLAEAQFREALTALKQTEGVQVLAAPRIITLDRRQAQARIGETQTIAGEEVHLGPSIDMVPYVSADGSGINLSVTARIDQLRSP